MFGSLKMEAIDCHICIPMIPKHKKKNNNNNNNNDGTRKSSTRRNSMHNLMSSISDMGSIDSDKDRDGLYIDGLTRIGEEDTDQDDNHIHTSLFMSVGSLIVLDHSHDSQTPIPFLVWGNEEKVRKYFPFISKASDFGAQLNYEKFEKDNEIDTLLNEIHPGFFHDQMRMNRRGNMSFNRDLEQTQQQNNRGIGGPNGMNTVDLNSLNIVPPLMANSMDNMNNGGDINSNNLNISMDSSYTTQGMVNTPPRHGNNEEESNFYNNNIDGVNNNNNNNNMGNMTSGMSNSTSVDALGNGNGLFTFSPNIPGGK